MHITSLAAVVGTLSLSALTSAWAEPRPTAAAASTKGNQEAACRGLSAATLEKGGEAACRGLGAVLPEKGGEAACRGL